LGSQYINVYNRCKRKKCHLVEILKNKSINTSLYKPNISNGACTNTHIIYRTYNNNPQMWYLQSTNNHIQSNIYHQNSTESTHLKLIISHTGIYKTRCCTITLLRLQYKALSVDTVLTYLIRDPREQRGLYSPHL